MIQGVFKDFEVNWLGSCGEGSLAVLQIESRVYG